MRTSRTRDQYKKGLSACIRNWRWKRHRSIAVGRYDLRIGRQAPHRPWKGRPSVLLGDTFRVDITHTPAIRGYSLRSYPRLLSGDTFSVSCTPLLEPSLSRPKLFSDCYIMNAITDKLRGLRAGKVTIRSKKWSKISLFNRNLWRFKNYCLFLQTLTIGSPCERQSDKAQTGQKGQPGRTNNMKIYQKTKSTNY